MGMGMGMGRARLERGRDRDCRRERRRQAERAVRVVAGRGARRSPRLRGRLRRRARRRADDGVAVDRDACDALRQARGGKLARPGSVVCFMEDYQKWHAESFDGASTYGLDKATFDSRLLACQLTFFTAMGTLIILTVAYSLGYSLLFFMPLLRVAGPEGRVGDICHFLRGLKCACCRRA